MESYKACSQLLQTAPRRGRRWRRLSTANFPLRIVADEGPELPQEEVILCPGLVVGLQLFPPHQIARTFVSGETQLSLPAGDVLPVREREGAASEEDQGQAQSPHALLSAAWHYHQQFTLTGLEQCRLVVITISHLTQTGPVFRYCSTKPATQHLGVGMALYHK